MQNKTKLFQCLFSDLTSVDCDKAIVCLIAKTSEHV